MSDALGSTDQPITPENSFDAAGLIVSMAKAIGLTLLFVFIMFVVTLGAAGWWLNSQINQGLAAAGLTKTQVKQLIVQGLAEPVVQTNDHKNFLILGTDTLATRGNVPPLTDTMMLVSLNLKTGRITTLSLPRDLWSPEYSTKINALLAYGIQRNPEKPTEFPTQVISELTGLPIHHTVILTLDDVAKVIDTMGGVEINVTEGFVDPEFPRPDLDVTRERDPQKLYMTVEFVPGVQVMSGERALQYIRSRHAAGDQGTDDARAIRQQQVIAALVAKAMDPELLSQPKKLGELYRIYQSQYASAFSVPQGIATFKQLQPILTDISFHSQSLSIYPDNPQGVLVHPPVTRNRYQNQWVYEVRNLDAFQQEIQDKLY